MCKKLLCALLLSVFVIAVIQVAAFAVNSVPTLVSVSPASGITSAGVWKTFTCIYSDANGASDLTTCRFAVNTSASCSGGAYVIYNRSTNKLSIASNAGVASAGVIPGTATTIASENAILDCGATTVTASGNNLTIVWRLQFKTTMAGKNCNLYMQANDLAGTTSGWVNKGNYSINAAPTTVSVSPTSGSTSASVWKTFTCVYSDANGASDLTTCRFAVNTSASCSGGAYVIYNRSTNKLSIASNAGVASTGVTPGTATTIASENAILDCGATTVTASGNNLTIVWKVQFKSTMTGKNCNLYMQDNDTLGASSGWVDKGDYSINAAPTTVSVSPASGITSAGVWKTFTCVFSDANGASDLTTCNLLVNNVLSSNGGAYLMYNKSLDKFYMKNNAGTLDGGVTRGTATTISTENAILDCGATTVTASGNNLTIVWKVQFKSTMTGTNCNLYMQANDLAGATSGWVDKGNYSINAAPTTVSISPASGSESAGVWKTFTCVYSDANGTPDLTTCNLLVNNVLSSNVGAYLMYNKSLDKFYMKNNAGTLVGGITRGTATTISTENAILDCGATTVTSSGNNLTVTWKLQFKSTMTGKNCNLYMQANDTLGASSGWVSKGTFTIGAPSASSLIELGKACVNSVAMMDPYDATSAATLMQQAENYFQQAKNLETNNPQANFGLAITDAALTAQDLINKYQDQFASDSKAYESMRYTVNSLQILNLPDMLDSSKAPLDGLLKSYTGTVTSPQFTSKSAPDPQLLLDMQADIKNVVRPMLSRVSGYLSIVETYGGSSFTFPIGTTAWCDYTIVDIGDVYLFDGALNAARWALAIPASYSVDIGTFNFDVSDYDLDTNHDGLLKPSEYAPPSPFLTLTDSAAMKAADSDMITAADKITAGINATLAETSDNYDLIRWHTPNVGPTQADLLQAKDYAAKLKASMTAPTTISWTDDDNQTQSIRVFLGAWNANPPSDLKAMFPTNELTRWRDDWNGCYEYSNDLAENGIPDDTFSGIFPDGVPGLYEDRTITVETGMSGTLVPSTTTTNPSTGATGVSTGLWSLGVSFTNDPPAEFSFNLQRYFAGAWRNVQIDSYYEINNNYNYTFYLDDNMWPNNNYRMIIKDEVHNITTTRTFTTGADAPF